MKLFLIDKPGCAHMIDLMPGIKHAYQLEQEFFPYLTVEFLPNRYYDPGVIIIAGKEKVRINVTLENQEELKQVRDVLFKFLNKNYNVTDLIKDDCLTDLRKMGKNKVTIGFNNILKEKKEETCCKVDMNNFEGNPYKAFEKKQAFDILHPVYKDDGRNSQDKELCMKNRYLECGDNFPKNTAQFKMCTDEVKWLCENGYPYNERTKIVEDAAKAAVKDTLSSLKKTDMKVDKKMFDKIAFAGFWDRPRNRAGNKYYKEGEPQAINFIADDSDNYDYYSRLIEGFEDKSYMTVYIILAIIIICIAYHKFIN